MFPSSICTQRSMLLLLSSYKVLLVEVQDSSRAFDPGFEITQAGRLFCPASISAELFLTAAGGRGAGQVATGHTVFVGFSSEITGSVLNVCSCANVAVVFRNEMGAGTPSPAPETMSCHNAALV